MSSYKRVGATPAAAYATLYWNTLKITDLVDTLRRHGADIDNDVLPHIPLLPFKHVVPNGTYFIEDE